MALFEHPRRVGVGVLLGFFTLVGVEVAVHSDTTNGHPSSPQGTSAPTNAQSTHAHLPRSISDGCELPVGRNGSVIHSLQLMGVEVGDIQDKSNGMHTTGAESNPIEFRVVQYGDSDPRHAHPIVDRGNINQVHANEYVQAGPIPSANQCHNAVKDAIHGRVVSIVVG